MLTPSPLVDLMLFFILALIAGQAWVQWRKGTFRLIDPLNVFLAGTLIVYVIQPIVFYDSLLGAYSLPHILKTLMMILFALSCVVIGYFLPLGRVAGNRLPGLPVRLDPQKMKTITIGYIVLGLLVYEYLIWSSGGLAAWASVGRGGTKYQDTSGYIYTLEHALPFGVTLLLFRAELLPASLQFRIFAWATGALQWIWFVYLGSRGRTILFMLTMLAIYYLPRRKNPRMSFLIAGMIFLFVLVNFQARYRGMFRDFSFNLDKIDLVEGIKSVIPQSMGGTLGEDTGRNLGDLEFNCAAAVVEVVPSQVTYNYGHALLELVIRPVPRAIWPDKPYPLLEAMTPIMEARNLSSYWVTTPRARYLSGPAFTFVGYYYMAGGALALLLAGVLTGAGFRALRTYIDRDPSNQGNMIFYTLLLPIGFGDSVATPFSWVWTYGILLLPMFFLLRWAGVRESQEFAGLPLEPDSELAVS